MAVIFWGCKRLKGRAGLLNPSPVQFLKVITRLTGEESTGKWQDYQAWVPFGICSQFSSVKLNGERGSEIGSLLGDPVVACEDTCFTNDVASSFAPAD